MSAREYPPVAFYFKVILTDAGRMTDCVFQEVSGIGSEMDLEEVVEGGENRFVHRLPKAVKHPNLVLKRGIANMDSPLVKWCAAVLEQGFDKPIVPKPVVVQLLNEKGEPLRAWSFANAFPVGWEIDGLDSTKNEVALEKLELSYSYLKRVG